MPPTTPLLDSEKESSETAEVAIENIAPQDIDSKIMSCDSDIGKIMPNQLKENNSLASINNPNEDTNAITTNSEHNSKDNGSAPVLEIEQVQHKHSENSNGKGNSIENPQIEVPISMKEDDKTKKTKNLLKKYFQKKTKGLTKRQKLIILVFIFVEFFAATVISIQAPFYPKLAEHKGAKAWQHGCVFGVFELFVFIMSPIFGTLMGKWSPKSFFNYGIFVTGASCVIFGFLNNIEDSNSFIISSVIVRAIEAIGDAAFVTASFTIIAVEFPDSVATTFATMETFYGLGMIAGPVIGGLLYDAGGYLFPFALMGGSLFVCAIATHFVLPSIVTNSSVNSIEEAGDSVQPPTSSGFAIFRMLKIPAVALIAYSIVSTAAGVGFLADTLQNHLKQFGIESASLTGCIFILNGGVYALTAPFWGRICEKTNQKKYITLAGAMFTILGFLIVGPSSIFPYDSSIWSTCLGLVLFGLGLGATLVSAFMQMLEDSIEDGYPDEISTYGYVSGLWTSMTALGFFIGPVAGGILLDLVGFRSGTLFIIAGQLILVVLVAFFLVRQHRKTKSICLEDIAEASTQDGPTCTESYYCADNAAYVMDNKSSNERQI